MITSTPLGYGYKDGSSDSTSANVAKINLYNLESVLKSDLKGQKFNSTQDFAKNEAEGIQDVKVSVEGVKICDIYVVIFQDKDGNRIPSDVEELYSTHDIVSYASSDTDKSVYQTPRDCRSHHHQSQSAGAR